MRKQSFLILCSVGGVSSEKALKNTKIVEALKNRNDKKVRKLLKKMSSRKDNWIVV
tara:strand:+ start:296 stop:463 length:168 start_codon:yes stop_codon:yes gene_type:complete